MARLIEKDDATHRALLQASGRDTKGAGNASADIRAELVGKGDTTHVSVLTDLTITGKVAQFGRGVLADVSAKLLDQFVANLEVTVLAEDLVEAGLELELEALDHRRSGARPREAAAGRRGWPSRPRRRPSTWSTTPSPTARRRWPTPHRGPPHRRPEPEPVDLLDAAGAPVAKRVLTLAAVITVAGPHLRSGPPSPPSPSGVSSPPTRRSTTAVTWIGRWPSAWAGCRRAPGRSWSGRPPASPW